MNNEHKVIHDFELNLIGDMFKDLERQGPCDPAITRQALGFVSPLGPDAQIADLGCGTGGQTLVLAEELDGHITAMDLMPAFVEAFRHKSAKLGLGSRIDIIEGSMAELPFSPGQLDLIWAEGSIYNIGYRRGLEEWNRYLKPGGYIAVSEASWFTDERPEEIQSFWDANYAEVDTIPNKVAQMQAAGYVPVAHFIMPESSWWNYFEMLAANYDAFLARQGNNERARNLVMMSEYEKGLYTKYRSYYGYVFYIGRKL